MPGMGNPTPEEMQKMYEEMQRKENEGLTPEEIEKKNREKEEKKQKNLKILQETLEICKNVQYEKDGRTVELELNEAQMSAVRVLLPDEVEKLSAGHTSEGECTCSFSCVDQDALSLAHDKFNDPVYAAGTKEGRILLLNLASAVYPGGGVRKGMNGQEEDLCRKSTLLQSLESDAAKEYYEYNKELDTRMGSDAVMVSPDVAVFRDGENNLLDEPFTISVLTCSAPNIRFGLNGFSEEEYKKMLYDRIRGILSTAGSLGYKNLILGAFGCGAFGNDAAVVSDAFKSAFAGRTEFDHADFAVLCKDGKDYNYREFCRNFGQ
ncbi:MAG: TIGR02452 family protein [Oscillospiraceae bacterium]|nr:TIGR02452 family protein [Oscillospiraceae bacterium]